jgi:hypothetical protein
MLMRRNYKTGKTLENNSVKTGIIELITDAVDPKNWTSG